MKLNRFAVRFVGLLCFLMLGTTGCFDALNKKGSYHVQESTDDQFQPFRETVYPLLQANNCTVCHSATQIPFIGSQNIVTAYHESKAKVSFESPETSRIAAKALDGHCSPQCRTSESQDWINAITQWRDLEAQQGGGGTGEGGGTGTGGSTGTGGGNPDFNSVTYVLREVDIPDVLNPNPTPITLDLMDDRVSGAGNFAGVRLQFDIDTIPNLANTYRIRNFRMNNTTMQAVSISGIYARLNGIYDPSWGAIYSTVSKIIQPGATTSLSASTMLVPKQPGSAHRIQFGFVSVSNFVCNQLAAFTQSVKPILKSTNPNKCLSCHGGGNGNATARFDMRSNVDADLCRIFMSKTSRDNPANSIAIIYPRNGAGGHPNQSAVFSAQDAMDFQTFIQQEWSTH